MDLEEIVEAYDRMRYCIFRQGIPLLPNWMDVEDLWQDIVLDGLIKVPQHYSPELSKLTTYVVMRGSYFIKNFRTKQSRRKVTLYPLDPGYDPEGRPQLDMTDYKQLIYRLTARMPGKHRFILRLKSGGMTDEAIGLRLGVSRQRVDQLLHKAMAAMQEAFDLDVEAERE